MRAHSFAELLVMRDRELWARKDSDVHSPEKCKDTLVTSSIDSDWKCCDRWQRKLSNKLNAKRFASSSVRVAELLWLGKRAVDIPFTILPDEYVVKTTTGWCAQQVQVVVNGLDPLSGDRVTRGTIRERFDAIMQTDGFEDGYILVEELIRPRAHQGMISRDYKALVFKSEVAFIFVVDRIQRTQRWYTPEWCPVSDRLYARWPLAELEPRPDNLHALLTAISTLATRYEYPFVRVDLYNGPNGPVFGEFTHAPNAGPSRIHYTPFANHTLGSLWMSACRNVGILPPGAI